MCIAGEESYFILKYQPDEVAKCLASREGMDSDGIEVAFDVSVYNYIVYVSLNG